MKYIETYKIKKPLPFYEVGTVVYYIRRYEQSHYRPDEEYLAEEECYEELPQDDEPKHTSHKFLLNIFSFMGGHYNQDLFKEWFELIEKKEEAR